MTPVKPKTLTRQQKTALSQLFLQDRALSQGRPLSTCRVGLSASVAGSLSELGLIRMLEKRQGRDKLGPVVICYWSLTEEGQEAHRDAVATKKKEVSA